MISKISSVDNNKYTPNWDAQKAEQPAFTGLGNLFWAGMQACEKTPMLNVSVLDLSTAIIPRSIIETKESNVFAGFEAFRRESSGLLVNCLLPGFIVASLTKLLQRPVMKDFGKSSLHNIWANEESLKIVQKYLTDAKESGPEKLESALKSFFKDLKGVDGSAEKAFSDFDLDLGIKKIVKSTAEPTKTLKKPEKLFKRGYNDIANVSHMTEHLKLNDEYLSKNLHGYLEDFVKIFKASEKEGIKSADRFSSFIKQATKLVNLKSIAGLAVIIPLAISMQPLNRWITKHISGVKGAPIYKDFGQNEEAKELTPKEKAALWKQKFISVGSMLTVMFLSMGGKLPNMKMLQFKGIFPTMDQARLISTATFSSRMLASEDKNELREATIRDIATFSSLYFLGDYAAKGIATLIEKVKPDIKLLNTLKEAPKNANALQKFGHWVKNVSLKSSDEVIGKIARNMRSACQLGNLAFSLIALGVFIPLYTRTQTNKKHEAELKKLAASINSTDGFLKNQIKNDAPAFQSFFS